MKRRSSGSRATSRRLRSRTTASDDAPSAAITVMLDPYDHGQQCDGESDDMLHFHAKILSAGAEIGSIEMILVERNRRIDFHSLVDYYDDELADVGFKFCDRAGKPRLGAVKAAGDNGTGGFLYIKKFKIDPEYRSNGATDAGATALRLLLTTGRLAERWSLAVYIPECIGSMDESELAAYDRALDRQREQRDAYYRSGCEEPAPWIEDPRKAFLANTIADARKFIRAGFMQATDHVNDALFYFFATPRLLRGDMMDHEAALAVPFCAAPEGAGQTPTGRDWELFCLARKFASPAPPSEALPAAQNEAFAASVDVLLRSGAAIASSHALHCCAAIGTPTSHVAMRMLLDRVQHKAVALSAKDPDGKTPLMVAAGANRGDTIGTVSILLGYGADKCQVGHAGKTAHDFFRQHRQGMDDFAGLLMPMAREHPEFQGDQEKQRVLDFLLRPRPQQLTPPL